MLRKSRLVLFAALLVAPVWTTLPAQAANAPGNPCAGNPCAAQNPCAANNPCAAKNPCGANNPCAPNNPCAAKNPGAAKNACARTEKIPRIGKPFTPPAGGPGRARSREPTITHPPSAFPRKRDASVKDAVARGRKIFRSIGCVSCHPRGRTIRGTAVDVTGARHPVPVPTLIGAADHFPRLSPAGGVMNVGQFNDWCATTFIGNPPMNPYSQNYRDLEVYVASLSPARYKRMLEWETKRKALMKTNRGAGGDTSPVAGNPAAPKDPPLAKNPCAPQGPGASSNPCAAQNPCAPQNPPPTKNPTTAKNPSTPANPCAPNNQSVPANPCAATNPCAAKNPCANNPCAPKNPCTKNPCAK